MERGVTQPKLVDNDSNQTGGEGRRARDEVYEA
jgi:hypothetical protein